MIVHAIEVRIQKWLTFTDCKVNQRGIEESKLSSMSRTAFASCRVLYSDHTSVSCEHTLLSEIILRTRQRPIATNKMMAFYCRYRKL